LDTSTARAARPKSALTNLPIVGTYLYYYNQFTKYIGHRGLLLGAISLITTLTEGIGIAFFIAYVQSLAVGDGANPSWILLRLKSFFESMNFEFVPSRVMPLLVVIFVLRGLLVILGKGYHYTIYTRLLGLIYEHTARAIASMAYPEYLKHNTGYFIQIVSKEVGRAVLAYYQVIAIIPLAVSIATYVALSIRIDWRFTIVAGIFGIFIVLVFRPTNRTTARLSRELIAAESKMTTLVVQLLHSFKYLLATNKIQPLQRKITACSDQVGATGSKIGFLSAILPASSEAIIVAFLGTMVYLQVEVFERSIDSMIVAMMFLYRAMREAIVLQGSWQAFNQYIGGLDILNETLNKIPDVPLVGAGKKFSGIHESLDLCNVTFRYGSSDVLKNINLKIPAKSMVAFVGESGAGKSTLVDLLTGLLSPTSGKVQIDGEDYAAYDQQLIRSHTGYVTQESVIFDDSIADNVSLWQWREDKDGSDRLIAALERAHCQSFVDNLPDGFNEIVGERGVRLSGGQRQRLSIARELYKEPGLLILDEATSALDSESERQVQESIDSLKGTSTIVVIAHRLATVRNCDRIFVLKAGSIVEQGNFNELRKNGGVFQRMCEAQSLGPTKES
jgi:ABC-type multidrug transport system fused ATPase/permease subunit